MRRLFATTTLALAFVAAPACDKKDEEKKDAAKTAKADAGKKDAGKKAADDVEAKAGDAEGGDTKAGDAKAGDAKTDVAVPAAAAGSLVEMVPEGAKVLVVVDLEGLIGSAAYKTHGQKLETGDMGKRMSAAKSCNLGPETWKQLVYGMDPDGDDAVAMAMGATGIGKKENIECIAGKYKEADPKADWTMEEKDGRLVVTVDGGDGVIYAVNDDTIVMASKLWNDAVAQRIAGKGTAAATGSLEGAMAMAGSGHITFAGLATKDMAGSPAGEVKHYGGSIDLGDGMKLAASVAYADPGTAAAKAKELSGMFQAFKGMVTGSGVPQAVADSVKIEAKDANLVISVTSNPKDFDALVVAGGAAMLEGM